MTIGQQGFTTFSTTLNYHIEAKRVQRDGAWYVETKEWLDNSTPIRQRFGPFIESDAWDMAQVVLHELTDTAMRSFAAWRSAPNSEADHAAP